MANTAVKVSAGPNHLTFLLTGDGTVAGPTIASATILADMVDGPLKDAWGRSYTNQAAMRTALLGGGGTAFVDDAGCYHVITLIATGVDVTAQVDQVVADVDTDAVTASRAEINIGMSDTTGQIAYLHLIHMHSGVR